MTLNRVANHVASILPAYVLVLQFGPIIGVVLFLAYSVAVHFIGEDKIWPLFNIVLALMVAFLAFSAGALPI